MAEASEPRSDGWKPSILRLDAATNQAPWLPRFPYAVTLILLYVAASLLVALVWLFEIKTEAPGWPSIVNLARTQTTPPFVKRRLLVDSSRLLAAIVPQSFWSGLESRIAASAERKDCIDWHKIVGRLNWKPENYPILFSSSFLIWLATLGFMFTCRWLVNLHYHTPRWLADLIGIVLGIMLLGGYSEWRYQGFLYRGYPYDVPQVFLFSLGLAAIVARRWWFPILFVAAAYSKETSVLLLVAYAMLAPSRRSVGFWTTMVLLAASYIGVRWWINLHFTPPADAPYVLPSRTFWFPQRNYTLIWRTMVFSCWWLVPVAIAVKHFISFHRQYSVTLKKLLILVLPLVGLAYFKGWFEELRQYMELLPVVGILVAQWAVLEMGRGDLMVARDDGADMRLENRTAAATRHDAAAHIARAA